MGAFFPEEREHEESFALIAERQTLDKKQSRWYTNTIPYGRYIYKVAIGVKK